MQSATGRWVVGGDFFGRDAELRSLERRIHDRNHVLLSGQRRVGKTSIARELGQRLEKQGWAPVFADVERAASEEDVIAELARAAHPVRGLGARLVEGANRWMRDNVDTLSAGDFHVKFRGELNAGNWRRFGDGLFDACANRKPPVLLVIDELPVFLSRLLGNDDGARRADVFLSWLRSAFQALEGGSPVAVLSGSIGFAPLVERLGIPDRINYLYQFEVKPWGRGTSVACFRRLAESNGLHAAEGVAGAVYDAIGLGVPHFVQSFFARLQDISDMRDGAPVTEADVKEVYRTGLLGPLGNRDLIYYEIRLREALDDDTYDVAMEILAEAAVEGVFSTGARRVLERLRIGKAEAAPERVVEQALGVLVHDGYLQPASDGHRFAFRLLKDWWEGRFRGRHVPLADRDPGAGGSGGR